MLKRDAWLGRVRQALRRARVVALIGPRQSGKTTLARQLLSPRSASQFDLESPLDRERLRAPMTALGGLRGLVVLDEIQRVPELFPSLRVPTSICSPAPWWCGSSRPGTRSWASGR